MIDLRKRQGLTPLGLMSNLVWHEDPKRLGIVLARYKFVAKMLAGSQDVLEVGCADAFCTRVVLQEVERLTAVDFDPLFIEDARSRMNPEWPFECREHDILEGPVTGSFDGVFALDLLEHGVGSDDDRATLSEEELQAEEAAQVEAASRASAGSLATDAAKKLFAQEQRLLEEMARIADSARGLPDARVRYLVDWIRDNMCPALPPQM